MDSKTVSLADAKARLSELAELAAAGETVVITRHGKPVVRMTRPESPRKPVDLKQLQQLTASMPPQTEDAGEFMRQMRDNARY